MHILLITNSYPMDLMGGAEIQTLILAKGLIKLGYEVSFLAADSDVESKSTINNIDVVKIPGKDKVGPARHRRYLENAILEIKPDICYIRAFNELMWALPFCKNYGIPVVTICCSTRDVSPFPFRFIPRRRILFMIKMRFFRHLLNFHSMRLSDAFVCNTRSLRDDIKRWYPHISNRVIYNAHNISLNEDVHKNYSQRVIWVNNVKRFKRPEIYIELASYFPEIEFAMIGRIGDSGLYNNYIWSLIQQGPRNLKYLGALPFDKVNNEISMSDILFYTSKGGEGFGNSLIQAWMRCVPTISLNYDPDGIIQRERIGYCSKNFSQLVNDTKELIGNPVLIREMGQRARKYAMSNHNSEHMITQYDILFRKILNQ